jgi:hypothetical protein
MSKIILSRKGYDDQYGIKPSIILPDRTMLSFPIPINPEKEDGKESSKLIFRDKTLTDYFKELGHKETNLVHHVDPDIYGLAGNKAMGAFGQAGAALTHLKVIGEGDIFLFFGTFSLTRKIEDKLKYEPMHTFHAIYGYLKVDKRVTINEIDTIEDYSWLKSHPHYFNRKGDYAKNNAIFIGKDYSYFNFSPALQLTKPGYHKSYWQLPLEFQGVALSYHDKSKQRITENSVEFASVAKGQEFVFERTARLEKWLENILVHKIGPKSLNVF